MRRYPIDRVTESDFEFVDETLPVRGPQQVLVRNIYLSLDPYIRPMMDPVRSYVPHLRPGDLIPGFAVGQVLESEDESLPPGSYVTGRIGWQSLSLVPTSALRRVDSSLGPISTAVGVLGMPGATAHFGLLEIGKPLAGETIVVSAAAGAVGSLAGQIAKIKGCRVVGIAGGAAKCRYVIDELGFDDCLDHHDECLIRRFEAATPEFVDISFENVGGEIMGMVLGRLHKHARVVLCGAVSQYDSKSPGTTLPVFELVRQRATITGFTIGDHLEHWPKAFADISQWIRQGKVKYRECISEGLRSVPQTFIGMLYGQNFGKQLVQIGPEY